MFHDSGELASEGAAGLKGVACDRRGISLGAARGVGDRWGLAGPLGAGGSSGPGSALGGRGGGAQCTRGGGAAARGCTGH